MRETTSRSRSTGAVVAALLALATCLVVLAAAGDADASSSTRCGRWTDHVSTSSRYCVRVDRIRSILHETDSYLLHNSHPHQTITGHCSWKHATTWTWHADVTVKAEAGLLFSKVSAEVSAGVQHSTTDETDLGFEFRIRPNHWAYCARGHAGFKVTGVAYRQTCSSSRCGRFDRHAFTARIPSQPFIDTGSGRNIDWSAYLVH